MQYMMIHHRRNIYSEIMTAILVSNKYESVAPEVEQSWFILTQQINATNLAATFYVKCIDKEMRCKE